jgi:capsular polysaccharide biosynthesis protein
VDRPRNIGHGPPNLPAISMAEADDPLYAGSTSSVDLGGLVQVILRRFWIVVVTAVWLTGATIGFSVVQTPEYEASVKIIIEREGEPLQNPAEVAGLQAITDTMVVAVKTRSVAEEVIRQLSLQKTSDEVLDNMSVHRVESTPFIEVDYKDTDPERAQLIANTIGTVFSDEIAEVNPVPNAFSASIWEPANIPESPEDPDPIRNGLLALVMGLVLGVGLALLLDYLGVPGDRRKK